MTEKKIRESSQDIGWLQNRPWHAHAARSRAGCKVAQTHTKSPTDRAGRAAKCTRKNTHIEVPAVDQESGVCTDAPPVAGPLPDVLHWRASERRVSPSTTTVEAAVAVAKTPETEIRAPVLIGHAVNWLEHTRARFGKNTSNSQ